MFDSRKIILVSNSPRRKKLLEQIGLTFDTISSNDVDEDRELYPPYTEAVERIAKLKGESVANRFKDAILISADTIVLFGDIVLGKPENEDKAACMLKILRDNEHQVITGVSIIDTSTSERKSFHEITDVEFGSITDEEIEWYVNSKEPMDKAGAYGIQGKAARFVRRINGCYFNVVGLPIFSLCEKLKEFDIVTHYKVA
jgi:septum formation protein